jgi:hypothetical protein
VHTSIACARSLCAASLLTSHVRSSVRAVSRLRGEARAREAVRATGARARRAATRKRRRPTRHAARPCVSLETPSSQTGCRTANRQARSEAGHNVRVGRTVSVRFYSPGRRPAGAAASASRARARGRPRSALSTLDRMGVAVAMDLQGSQTFRAFASAPRFRAFAPHIRRDPHPRAHVVRLTVKTDTGEVTYRRCTQIWWLHRAQIWPRSSKLARQGRASIGGTGGNGRLLSARRAAGASRCRRPVSHPLETTASPSRHMLNTDVTISFLKCLHMVAPAREGAPSHHVPRGRGSRFEDGGS